MTNTVAVGPRLALLAVVLVPAAAVVAEATQSWLLGVVSAVLVLIGACFLDVVRAGSPGTIVVHRDSPGSVVMGHEAEMKWRIENLLNRPRSVWIADDLAPSLMAGRRAHLDLPEGGSGEVVVGFRPTRRGLFDIERLTVRVDGPWKFMGRQGDRLLPTQIRVVPRFRSKREVELRLHRARLLEVGARSVRARGGGTEFDHLRDYSVDDSYRHIDWSATARAGRPIVRSYRAEQHQTVIVMLDNGRLMAAKSGGVTRLEHAMDAVMALATVSSHVGDRLGLVAFDRSPHRVVAPGRGRQQMSQLTETMFALQPVLSESDYDAAVTSVLAHFRRRALVVLLTDLVDPVVKTTIVPAVAALTTRHRVVVGAVSNSDVIEWSERVPASADEAFLTGSALNAIDDRLRASRRLQVTGATVVDVDAGRLGPSLVDHYLETKARGG